MDLLDAVEVSRFAGREFLIWVWFESEVFEGQFKLPDGSKFTLWLENQLTLEAEAAEREVSRMRGAAPSLTSEAHEALRRGKLPAQARLRIERGEHAFGFVLTAETLAMSGVSLPALLKEEIEERFYERMFLMDDLEHMVDTLYGQFLSLRLTPEWETDVLPTIRAWVQQPHKVGVERYLEVREQAKPLGRGKLVDWGV